MSRLFHVALREYLENVKTKAFLIAVFMTPVLFGASFFLPAVLASTKTEVRHLVVVDLTGALGSSVAGRLASRRAPGDARPLYETETVELSGADDAAREEELRRRMPELDDRVLSGQWFAYVVLRRSALDRSLRGEDTKSQYRTGNLWDAKVAEDVSGAIADEVNARVVAKTALPPAEAAVLTTKPPFDVQNVRAAGKGMKATLAATMIPFAFTFLLFLAIVTISQALITSTLEEKSNRVIEVLLSSVSPSQLMTGKILGTCAVGLTLMAIWTVGGVAGLAMNGLGVVPASQLLLGVVYYLLGFLLFASLMVAVGSACNTLKEAQNLLAPVMGLLSISLIFVIAIGRDPHGPLARVLTFIPVLTPFLMMMRITATPPAPPLEIAASIVVLALSAWLAMRLAARVFRVGVLMYGKPPSLRELFRWMRAK